MHFASVPTMSMENDDLISVEVCYITPQVQFHKTLLVPEGSTIQTAILSSGLLNVCTELDMNTLRVGIYSRLKTLDTGLKAQDRVEVYRPLHVDPMAARRARAQKNKKNSPDD